MGASGLKQRDAIAREALGARLHRGAGDDGDASSRHCRAPNDGGRHAGSGRNGVDHQAFERALPQLADQEPREEVGLARRRACEKLGQQRRLAPGRSRAARRRDLPERSVHVTERQRCDRFVRRGPRVAQTSHSRSRSCPGRV
jgi:hypothetical protein